MKIIVSALIALSMLAVLPGLAIPASAADCKVTGWIDSGTAGRPIWSCPDTAK